MVCLFCKASHTFCVADAARVHQNVEAFLLVAAVPLDLAFDGVADGISSAHSLLHLDVFVQFICFFFYVDIYLCGWYPGLAA